MADGNVMGGGDAVEDGVVLFSGPDQGGVGLEEEGVGAAVGDEGRLGAEGMQFELV